MVANGPRHWLIPDSEAEAEGITTDMLIGKILEGFAGKPDLAIDDDPQSLVIRKILVKKPQDHWKDLPQQVVRALKGLFLRYECRTH